MTAPDKNASATDRPALSLQDRVRRELGLFTEAERRVAQALLGEYPMAGLETVARFARRANTSGPTILRFTSRLGFENYADFQEALRAEIQVRLQGPLSRYAVRGVEDGPVAPRDGIAQAMVQNIDMAERDLRQHLPWIVARLSDLDRKVFCIGGRFSWMVASYLHHYLRELRPGVRLIRDSSAAWADYLLDVGPGDTVVVFDFRRYQRDVLDFAKGAAGQKASIILVTDIWYSPIAAFADIVVPCPVSIPSAFDSGVTGLAMAEIITAGVVDALGARSKDRIATLENLRKPFNLGS
ncbi:MurR/RpiR family transcriptional regulator [Loktanella sp. M215]|uniref:MurR/RpiR family transcriptional regulator n=1 Tax=Loktanella sp. M215 TaxID=2675431 RepID=UPI001F1B99A3|nr:MurR/RpiR family transcriptional regulator [Loktanella sp. M215]MCF7701351.1 SIS domain-containing protein [Loktanella sp. M215]